MGFLLQIIVSCPCALSRQVAGAGCRCWCCELAVHVVTGCWWWCRVPVPVLVLVLGARCRCWCCELAVHVVETGCWCCCRVPVLVLGAGCRCWCWCCELAVHWCWCRAGAGAVHVVEAGCWCRCCRVLVRAVVLVLGAVSWLRAWWRHGAGAGCWQCA